MNLDCIVFAQRPKLSPYKDPIRRRIAENLQESKRRIPHFTYVDEVDVTDLEATRAMMNADRGDDPKLTLLPFLITAMCRTLADYPQINATFDDEAGVIHRSGAVHMGMATQTDNGLSVAVIRNAADVALRSERTRSSLASASARRNSSVASAHAWRRYASRAACQRGPASPSARWRVESRFALRTRFAPRAF